MFAFLQIILLLIAGVAVAIGVARSLFAVPEFTDRVDSVALGPPESSPLVDAIEKQWQGRPDKTGVVAIGVGADAFAARMILAERATSSIDAQYYIWRNDLTGMLLLDALKRAADRGVRVRLLVDDNGTSGLDARLTALDAHENAEVRVYNPFNLRRFKRLSFVFDFFRLNRRMHNKSFTVDGSVTILGGRNIGDEYFDTGTTALYVDLDVLAVGAAVADVAADFDLYWAARAVHPVSPIMGKPPQGDPIGDAVVRYRDAPQFIEYRDVIRESDVVHKLVSGTIGLEWTQAVLVSDDPIKGLGAVPREDLLTTRLLQAVGRIEHRFDGISPYFVPGGPGIRAFKTLVSQGVAVRMLTNSLEATDVLPVHAGYTKRRRDLLKLGVGVFELKRQSTVTTPREKMGPFGSSGASLHAKTFAVDGERIFIGSFNFDPRSTTLNTEMGLLIDSRDMASGLHEAFDRRLDGHAWEVGLVGRDMVWRGTTSGTETTDEPGTTLLNRIALTVIGWLPVEWLL